MVIVATTTMPSLLLRDVLFISNSTDELETPRAFATEFVNSVFTASKLDSVNPSKVNSAIILVVAVVVEAVVVVVVLVSVFVAVVVGVVDWVVVVGILVVVGVVVDVVEVVGVVLLVDVVW